METTHRLEVALKLSGRASCIQVALFNRLEISWIQTVLVLPQDRWSAGVVNAASRVEDPEPACTLSV